MESNKNIFMIIDGSAMVHRAYHAMPPFTTSSGTPTGATSGFFNMLLKLLQQMKPKYLFVAFDRPKPTFRQQLYVGYQAQRPKMESDLSEQFRSIIEILDKAKITQVGIDGFEADDIIGTVSARAQNMDEVVYIVTGDRDMLQLVDKETFLLMPVKGISEVILHDMNSVREKYGVEPSQIIDLKSLTGDASDNYPGVPGIGPKTAANLIAQYGNFENIYKHLDDIATKNKNLAQKLIDGSESGNISHKLATIVRDVPLKCDFDDCLISNIDIEAFKKALDKYEFHTLPKKVDEILGRGEDAKKANQMKLI
ncbi:MAG TPA: 5'-3' exonuclease H3TH domain-containing protein [Patescibacteria group bacterium]|nr:5'-3' exonuclease H3TH domain-containing protein [Patescibacteria group bacterium]